MPQTASSVTLAALGDSLTAGWGLPAADAYPAKPAGALLHWTRGEAARRNEAAFSAVDAYRPPALAMRVRQPNASEAS